ncbi:MAG: tRNA (adenosine(37)-N6)-dimethylallyltransferase MiaA [Candidatus Saccharimonadaceae bacterium]
MKNKLPLVVMVGPTASGKTSLAVELAQRFNGEIVCADSRTIYTGMDIGTAKPTLSDRALVPHWGLDLVEPGQRFTAADFKQYAYKIIDDIRLRGKVPFLVGGTGLYVNSVLYDYQFGPDADRDKRTELEAMDLSKLHEYCSINNIKLPDNFKNKRYVIRAIELSGVKRKRDAKKVENSVVVGIATEKTTLTSRIHARTEHLFDDGVVEEAIKLSKKYGWDSEAMTGNVYPVLRLFVAGNIDKQEAFRQIETRDWQLAKRQATWFKRNPDITWLSLGDAREYLADYLENS